MTGDYSLVTGLITPCVLIFFVWLTVSTRIYVKHRLIRNVAMDDWIMLFSAIAFTAYASVNIVAVVLGLGIHEANLTPRQVARVQQFCFYLQIFYVICTVTVKSSIAIMLLRVSTVRPFVYWAIMATAIIYSFAGVVSVTVLCFQCIPLAKYWNKGLAGTCIDSELFAALSYAFSGGGVYTDFVFAATPIWLISGLNLDRRTKWSAGLVLALGFSTVGVAGARMNWIRTLGLPFDSTFYFVPLSILSLLEVGIGIIAGSMATFRPLLRKISSTLSSRNTTCQLSDEYESKLTARPSDDSNKGILNRIAVAPIDMEQNAFMHGSRDGLFENRNVKGVTRYPNEHPSPTSSAREWTIPEDDLMTRKFSLARNADVGHGDGALLAVELNVPIQTRRPSVISVAGGTPTNLRSRQRSLSMAAERARKFSVVPGVPTVDEGRAEGDFMATTGQETPRISLDQGQSSFGPLSYPTHPIHRSVQSTDTATSSVPSAPWRPQLSQPPSSHASPSTRQTDNPYAAAYSATEQHFRQSQPLPQPPRPQQYQQPRQLPADLALSLTPAAAPRKPSTALSPTPQPRKSSVNPGRKSSTNPYLQAPLNTSKYQSLDGDKSLGARDKKMSNLEQTTLDLMTRKNSAYLSGGVSIPEQIRRLRTESVAGGPEDSGKPGRKWSLFGGPAVRAVETEGEWVRRSGLNSRRGTDGKLLEGPAGNMVEEEQWIDEPAYDEDNSGRSGGGPSNDGLNWGALDWRGNTMGRKESIVGPRGVEGRANGLPRKDSEVLWGSRKLI